MPYLKEILLDNNILVGYKGVGVEYNLLKKIWVKSLYIELLGCPKYEQLLEKYDVKHECCKYHINNSFHCSANEVKIFLLAKTLVRHSL